MSYFRQILKTMINGPCSWESGAASVPTVVYRAEKSPDDAKYAEDTDVLDQGGTEKDGVVSPLH